MEAVKKIDARGVTYLQAFSGSCRWYWGMKLSDGDLYEAEELYRQGRDFSPNRLVLVAFPEGRVLEPVKAASGQYFGRPVCDEGRIVIPLADFPRRRLTLLAFDEETEQTAPLTEIDLDQVEDCYNLLLHTSPLTLTRQGGDGRFQIVWPERAEFALEPRETFDFRDGDLLYFARWYEDPDYREEVIVRRYPRGELADRYPGTILNMPDGQKWRLG